MLLAFKTHQLHCLVSGYWHFLKLSSSDKSCCIAELTSSWPPAYFPSFQATAASLLLMPMFVWFKRQSKCVYVITRLCLPACKSLCKKCSISMWHSMSAVQSGEFPTLECSFPSWAVLLPGSVPHASQDGCCSTGRLLVMSGSSEGRQACQKTHSASVFRSR